jgi:F-type H+-transporting ATPase subunit b|tara:strand:+ start:805 stop:1293 length:489 start_codon:yes stop_codon:yes gene_type:complete
MIIDATFWVAISFVIFLVLVLYFKIPNKVNSLLKDNITDIKNQINDAEKLKEEAKNILSENEKKLSNAKIEIKFMIEKANEEVEKDIIKKNSELHKLMDNRKRSTEDKIRQMKEQALKDVKNTSIKIAISSVERLLKNSLDKNKLDKIYSTGLEEAKIVLKK